MKRHVPADILYILLETKTKTDGVDLDVRKGAHLPHFGPTNNRLQFFRKNPEHSQLDVTFSSPRFGNYGVKNREVNLKTKCEIVSNI